MSDANTLNLEAFARLARSLDEAPDMLNWNGVLYRILIASEQTGGALSLVDSISPIGSGPPLHVHEAEDETFYVMSGTLKFFLDGQTVIKQAGDAVFVPRGKVHTFQVLGDTACRHLVMLTPGGFENFFVEMARGQFNIPADMAAIEASGQRHNMRFAGPPLDMSLPADAS
jgi:quercetin dioxygenase-like cupin family protein